MKKLKTSIIFFLCSIACTGQNLTINDKMERFDIEKFKRNAAGKLYYKFTTDEAEILQRINSIRGGYLEEYIPFDNPYFKTVKYFDEKGVLRETGVRYCYTSSFLVGVWKYYNEKEEFIEQKDYNESIYFDWDKILKIAEHYDVNLKDWSTRLKRNFETEIPCWELDWALGEASRSGEGYFAVTTMRQIITIDARNYDIINTRVYLEEMHGH
jgi:hypothetical protein